MAHTVDPVPEDSSGTEDLVHFVKDHILAVGVDNLAGQCTAAAEVGIPAVVVHLDRFLAVDHTEHYHLDSIADLCLQELLAHHDYTVHHNNLLGLSTAEVDLAVEVCMEEFAFDPSCDFLG